MLPDDPGAGVPTWTKTFALEPAALDDLYHTLAENRAFSTRWRKAGAPPVRGNDFDATLTANAASVTIPAFVVPSQAAAQGQIADAITALVPHSLWDALETRRQPSMAEHGAHPRRTMADTPVGKRRIPARRK